MTLKEALLADIEAFLASTGMKHTTFGYKVMNDPAFVSRLREGRDVRTDTIDRVRAFMEEARTKERPKRRQALQPAA